LIEAGQRLLPAFPQELSIDARKRLEKLGVEVVLGKPVTQCDAEGVEVGGLRVATHTIVWAAGVAASPAAHWLGSPADRAGRAIVGPKLTVQNYDNIFVIGDTASAKRKDGTPVPGLATAAKQEGAYVASAIKAKLSGSEIRKEFVYRNLGNLATIGRNAAVIDFGVVRLTGWPAWLLWSMAHIYFLVGFRNRFVAACDWVWTYLTYERGARLITGVVESVESDAVRDVARTPLASIGH
jgi:NADH dehydrogenase